MSAKAGNSTPKSAAKTPASTPRVAKKEPPGRVVSGLLRSGAQAKLRVGASDDPQEREADAVAERVVSGGMGDGDAPTARGNARKGPSWSVLPTPIQRAQAAPDDATTTDSGTESRIQSMRGGGRSLSSGERTLFESRMGYDFSGVRVHEGSAANQAANSIQAKAFTLGNDVFMGSGQYQPNTDAGNRLMAHELTHVVQQGGAAPGVIRRKKSENSPERQRAINAAIAWNRRHHKFTMGLALELFKIARTNTPFRRIKETQRIDENFVWLVGDTQRKLGMKVSGRLDQTTIRRALTFSGGSVGSMAKILLNIARKIIINIPSWMFGPVPFLGGLFKNAALSLVNSFARLPAATIARMVVNTARALTSWKFVKAFLWGVFDGFIKDGFIATAQGIWEIIKLPKTIFDFGSNVLSALKDFSIMGSLREIFNSMRETAGWIANNGRAILSNISRAANRVQNASVGSLFQSLAKSASSVGTRIGNAIFEFLHKFLGKSATDIGQSLGTAAGRFTGNAGWTVLLGVITAGAGAAVARTVPLLRPVFRILATPLNKILGVVKRAWTLLQGFLTKAVTGFGSWLAKAAPKLAGRFQSIFAKIQQFFARLVARANRGPAKPKPSPKPSAKPGAKPGPKPGQPTKPRKPNKPKDKDKPSRIGDGEVGKVVHFGREATEQKHWIQTAGTRAVPMMGGTPTTVSAQLNSWKRAIKDLPTDKQAKARKLLKIAADRLTKTERLARKAARIKRKAARRKRRGALIAQFIQADNLTEAAQTRLAGTLETLVSIFSGGTVYERPFKMNGHPHSLFVEIVRGRLKVSMASATRQSVEARYRKVDNILKNYLAYFSDVTDEKLKTKIQEIIEMIESQRDNKILEFVQQLEAKGIKSKDREKIRNEISRDADKLAEELTTYALDAYPDLTPEDVEKELQERAYAKWLQEWRAKQEEVKEKLAQFVPRWTAIGADAKLLIRGSLAKGIKKKTEIGPSGERLAFNPEDFDIDAFVASDIIFRKAMEAGAPQRDTEDGAIVGSQSQLREVRELVKDMRTAAERIAGARDHGPRKFKFNVLIRSLLRADEIRRTDRQDARRAGLPLERGNPLEIPPPTR